MFDPSTLYHAIFFVSIYFRCNVVAPSDICVIVEAGGFKKSEIMYNKSGCAVDVLRHPF
jgi:hypothetical protein